MVWKWLLVRAAGFPARQVLQLASPDVVAAADAVLELERARAPARIDAIADLKRALDRPEGPERRVADKALKALQRHKYPTEIHAGLPSTLAALVDLEATRVRRHADFEAVFAADQLRIARVVRATAADPRFREAVLWQNRRALHRGIDWLLTHEDSANSRARQNQQVVASYLQRYCVKNDCIGFFGPVGWGRMTGDPDVLKVRPGADLLDKRTVYFEHWCVDALADVLGREPALRPHARPRRMPTVYLDGTTVCYPTDRRSELPLPYARLLAACDGRTSARTIAATLLADTTLGIGDEAEVYDLLSELCEKRFCTWTFEVPTVTEWPERHLRTQLEDAGGEAREHALQRLAALEDRRAAVERAAGNAGELDRALGELEDTFEQLTSLASTRKGGQTYAARTLVYEDCRRDLDLELGVEFRERHGPPLALVLQTARWYTFRIAELYREALTSLFDRVATSESIDYLTFWRHAKLLFPEHQQPASLVVQARRELQEKWGAIAMPDAMSKHLELATHAIASRVTEAFAAPHPGWPSARYHSPDVLIAARDVDAIRAGTATVVLGELHPSVCTIHFFTQKEHAEREAMVRAREVDFPSMIPAVVYAKEHATRADHMWVSSHDLDIELGTTRSWRPREHVVAVADLVVEREAGQLLVRDRGGRWRFEIVEFYGGFLSACIANDFTMFPLVTHVPRISIDGLVVTREQWCPALEPIVQLASMEPGTEQFLAVRRWARELGLPRWVFVKVLEEPKPVYVDFDSPIYVEMLAKLVRKTSKLTVSEMLPSPEDTWLPDGAGQTYTCELRIVAVDSTHWHAPAGPGHHSIES